MRWANKETVVVPVDFSDASFAALGTASELVAGTEHLHVVHVLPHPHPVDPDVLLPIANEETYRADVQSSLERRLADSPYAGAHVSVRFGNPGDEIVRHARSVGADLIVIPSHGYSGLKHLLLGSVAERVVRHATCPVLVLRR